MGFRIYRIMQESVNQERPNKIFADVREVEITKAIANEFHSVLIDRAESDVIIIGAGPAGLTAGRELSTMGFKVLIVEQNNYLGGGYWLGGYMMNPVTVREPAQKIWDELGIPYKKVSEGLYLTPGPHAVSKLIAGACDSGVKFLNLTKFDDLVLKKGRVSGVVVNWMPVSALPRNITCVDPIALESKMVIDASGHDSVAVKRLVNRNLVEWKGMNPMWVSNGFFVLKILHAAICFASELLAIEKIFFLISTLIPKVSSINLPSLVIFNSGTDGSS